MKSQYTAFVGCQSCQTHIGSSAPAVRGGTTQSPASMYQVQLFLPTLHGTATDVYKKVFFALHNLFMFIPVYRFDHGHPHFVQILLLTNLLSITMPYHTKGGPKFSR